MHEYVEPIIKLISEHPIASVIITSSVFLIAHQLWKAWKYPNESYHDTFDRQLQDYMETRVH